MLERLQGGVYLSKDGKIIPENEGRGLYNAPDDAR